jgi:hypothetical protein
MWLGWLTCWTGRAADDLFYLFDRQTRSKHNGHRPHHRHHHHGGPAPQPQQPQQQPPAPSTAEANQEEEEPEAEPEEEAEPGLVLLVGVPRVYSCGSCRAHLASDLDVVSRVRGFVGGWFVD